MSRTAKPTLTISAEVVVDDLNLRLRGVLEEFQHRSCILELKDDPSVNIPLGTEIVIQLPTVEGARITGTLKRWLGRRLTIDVQRRPREQKRYFPRASGGVAVEYQRLPNSTSEVVQRSWLKGLSVADDVPCRTEQIVDFSASGVRCQDEIGCRVGDLLFLSLELSPSNHTVRAIGRVVRCYVGSTNEMAVDFVDVTGEGMERLARHTIDRQMASLDELHTSNPA